MRVLFLFFYLAYTSHLVKAQQRDYLLIKVTYVHKLIPEDQPTAYAIMDMNKFMTMKIDDSTYRHPNLLYVMTKNGGIYAWNNYSKEYSYACYKYGDASKAYFLSEDEKKDIINLKFSDFTINQIMEEAKNKQMDMRFSDSVEDYTISCYKIDVDFCSCNLFMNSPTHPLYNNNGAYIRKVNKVKKISKSEQEEIQKIIEQCIR
jgi:hypothetical protein